MPMMSSNTYTSGEFSKRSNVSIRTIRYYDKIGLLKPTFINEAGYRLYTDADFIKLQKIIVLKNLGFSLEDISAMTRTDTSSRSLKESFDLQLTLVRNKIDELKRIEQSLSASSELFEETKEPDWNKLIPFIHLMNMQESISEQYKNSKNIDVRIRLHQNYSHNMQGWYPWIFAQVTPQAGDSILELGCGNGKFWLENAASIPNDCNILLSDVSEGMLRQAKSNLLQYYNQGSKSDALQHTMPNFTYNCFDCSQIPYPDQSFDLIYANHLLFYVKDFDQALSEIKRVLKPGGRFCCTTYGQSHMKEIDQLVKEFDTRIALSEIKLYDIFGLEHGKTQLNSHFTEIKRVDYEDYLTVTNANDLLEYIYSCHGNQMTYLKGQIEQFEAFIQKKIGKHGLKITKAAGMFLCQ